MSEVKIHPEDKAAKLCTKHLFANENNMVEFLVLPNDVHHYITPFVFKCHSFEFSIDLEFHSWPFKYNKLIIPQPFEVRNAFDKFYHDRDVEPFKAFGCVYFKCKYVLCDECLYVTLPQYFLSDELAFQKAYSTFYNNFNPNNYISYV